VVVAAVFAAGAVASMASARPGLVVAVAVAAGAIAGWCAV